MKEFPYHQYKEVIEEIIAHIKANDRKSIQWRAFMITYDNYLGNRKALEELENVRFYKSDFGTVGSILKFLEADYGFDVTYCRNVNQIQYYDTMYIYSHLK